jgi:hypothetical protein
MITKVVLKHGEIALIDSASIQVILGRSWKKCPDGYAIAKSGGKIFAMHRLIIGAKPGQIVDHINRDRLDNRLENLRIVDASLNALNRGARGSSSKYKGVAKHKNGWQVCVNKKYIGLFRSEQDAAKAYDVAVVSEYGNKAVTNQMLGLL